MCNCLSVADARQCSRHMPPAEQSCFTPAHQLKLESA
jgi:hypothetical protein